MQAGWYPDPGGVHEFRYHNGVDWTGDVSTDGIRHVAPLDSAAPLEPDAAFDPTTSHKPERRSAMSALVLGIIAMTLGIIPFLCFFTVVLALAAVILGVRRRGDTYASAGIVTGLVGLLLSITGIVLTVILLQAVTRFEDPGDHEVELTSCEEVDGVTRASGTITNLENGDRTYTIEVTFDGDARADTVVEDVPAGATRAFDVDEDLRFPALDCSVVSVKGPLPFGLRP